MNTAIIGNDGASAAPQSRLSGLATATREPAKRLFTDVATAYLEFRRRFYHEEQPSLVTPPPANTEIHQAELARLAESTLRLLPQAVKTIPVVGGTLEHLQQVADLHTISERERTALHTMAIVFLRGVVDGIQPWYAEWVLAAANSLDRLSTPSYYITHPWDALLYKEPAQLAAFERAIETDDYDAIERSMEQLGDRLIDVLGDPIGQHAELAFTGPEAEHRHTMFNLKTSAALALGAYFLASQVHSLIEPRHPVVDDHSVLPPHPDEAQVRLSSNGA